MESHTLKPHSTEEVFDKLKEHFTDKITELNEFCVKLIEMSVTDSLEFEVADMENIGMPWHIIKVAFKIRDGSYLALTPEELASREQGRMTSVREVLEQT